MWFYSEFIFTWGKLKNMWESVGIENTLECWGTYWSEPVGLNKKTQKIDLVFIFKSSAKVNFIRCEATIFNGLPSSKRHSFLKILIKPV